MIQFIRQILGYTDEAAAEARRFAAEWRGIADDAADFRRQLRGLYDGAAAPAPALDGPAAEGAVGGKARRAGR